MSKKNAVRVVVCAFLLIFLIGYLMLVFSFPRDQKSDMVKERFNSFYAQEKNTIDGIYIGSSGVDRYWIPGLAYNNYGITVYGFTSGNQSAVFAKYLMKEALKEHDVKCFLVDIRGVLKASETINDTDIRRVTDNLRLSKNKWDATKAVLDFVETGETKIDTSDLSYYVSFGRYHSRWGGDISMTDFTDLRPESEYMGYFAYNTNAFKQRPQEETVVNESIGTIREANEAVLMDLLDYCDTLEAEVIFVSSPQYMTQEEQPAYNYVFSVIESRGYKTINFNTEKMYKALDWNFDTDLYNSGHANIYGAIKFTNYLAEYLQDEIGLVDHRTENSDMYDDYVNAHKALVEESQKYDSNLEKLLNTKPE